MLQSSGREKSREGGEAAAGGAAGGRCRGGRGGGSPWAARGGHGAPPGTSLLHRSGRWHGQGQAPLSKRYPCALPCPPAAPGRSRAVRGAPRWPGGRTPAPGQTVLLRLCRALQGQRPLRAPARPLCPGPAHLRVPLQAPADGDPPRPLPLPGSR